MPEALAAAIVLAAGEGRRMGGPKALLVVDGLTLVERHVARLREVGVPEIVVVVRPAVAPAIARAGVRAVVATTCSQACSLAAGLAALRPGGTVLVTPVDAVPAEPATIAELLARRAGAIAATPERDGAGGHPVLVDAAALAAVYAPPACDEPRHAPAPPLRTFLRELGDRRRKVSVTDPAVHVDLDLPSDLARHVRA